MATLSMYDEIFNLVNDCFCLPLKTETFTIEIAILNLIYIWDVTWRVGNNIGSPAMSTKSAWDEHLQSYKRHNHIISVATQSFRL